MIAGNAEKKHIYRNAKWHHSHRSLKCMFTQCYSGKQQKWNKQRKTAYNRKTTWKIIVIVFKLYFFCGKLGNSSKTVSEADFAKFVPCTCSILLVSHEHLTVAKYTVICRESFYIENNTHTRYHMMMLKTTYFIGGQREKHMHMFCFLPTCCETLYWRTWRNENNSLQKDAEDSPTCFFLKKGLVSRWRYCLQIQLTSFLSTWPSTFSGSNIL